LPHPSARPLWPSRAPYLAPVFGLLPAALARMEHGPAIERLLAVVEEAFGCERRLDFALVLHRNGRPEGRRMAARCLHDNPHMPFNARRHALECLLSPSSVLADQSLETSTDALVADNS